jgi:hypothetical protein
MPLVVWSREAGLPHATVVGWRVSNSIGLSSTRRLADVAKDVIGGQPLPANPRDLAKGRAEQAKDGETTAQQPAPVADHCRR